MNEETVGVDPDTGRPEALVNSRRLGMLHATAQLYKPETICKEAFEHHSDRPCCQRQIASILGVSLSEVCEHLEDLEPGCSELGCTPDLLLDYAKQRGYGLVCLHNNRPCISHEGAPILAFSVVAEHAYFYKSQIVARQVMKWRGGGGEKLKRKFRHTKAWVRPDALAADTLEPGHFSAWKRKCLRSASGFWSRASRLASR